jgi:hypothetical protein
MDFRAWILLVYLSTVLLISIEFHGFLSSLSYICDAPLLPVQEACYFLPKISSKETHPKIAQVLLECYKPDMTLLVLKCAGRDSFSATENFEKDGVSAPFGWNYKPAEKHCWLIFCERKILFRLKQAE